MRIETGFRKTIGHLAPGFAKSGSARPPLRLARIWQGIGWLMVATVVWLSLTPDRFEPPTPLLTWDKAQHALAYGSLMYWFGQAFQPHWRWPAFFLCLGIGLEFLQGVSGHRTFDAADILANSIGVGLGLALVRTPLGRLLSAVDARIGAIRFR
ncbi:uncharacterized protein sS8_4473 [Methylocaldum marinum]|uniref:VanZ-like domain-containing protein n=1 Tax=Methylocaldum marinum TaxID=1432792 RepID=A0A250KXK8_9GAMM|nr:VanZ family protein [Methylocaldum marinum]BBA36403.1 uncharacterized protein sS8_4473 [Methylocaldum marinum]